VHGNDVTEAYENEACYERAKVKCEASKICVSDATKDMAEDKAFENTGNRTGQSKAGNTCAGAYFHDKRAWRQTDALWMFHRARKRQVPRKYLVYKVF
jgi:hypothetical protein